MAYLKGQPVNMRTRDYFSRVVEDDAPIGFGVAVFQGDEDRGITADGDNFVGVTVQEFNMANGFGQQMDARVAARGVIAVEVSGDVEANDSVGYDGSDGTFSNGGTTIKGARFVESGSEGDIVPAFFDGVETESGGSGQSQGES